MSHNRTLTISRIILAGAVASLALVAVPSVASASAGNVVSVAAAAKTAPGQPKFGESGAAVVALQNAILRNGFSLKGGATGNFELNVAIPVMGNSLLESIRLLSNSMRLLADKTIRGLEANEERARALAESSPSIVTPLNKYIGYEAAAKIAKHSVKNGLTVREATIELGYVDGETLTLEQLDAALDVLSMTKPAQ